MDGVRPATEHDAPACAELYAAYVRGTSVTFELEPPDAAEMARRIAAAHEWLVLTDGGRVVGYAYAGPFKERAAYRWTCEVSVYLEQGRRRTGAGRRLYDVLLARLAERGFRQAVAVLTLPNDASEGLHRAMGFSEVGTFRRVGWKAGAWHDVRWLQRPLGPDDDRAPEELS